MGRHQLENRHAVGLHPLEERCGRMRQRIGVDLHAATNQEQREELPHRDVE